MKSFNQSVLVQKPEEIYNLKLYCGGSDRGTSPYPKTSRHVLRPKEKGPWDNLELFYTCQKSPRNVFKLFILKLFFHWKNTPLIFEGLLVICLLLKGKDHSCWTPHGGDFRVLQGPADLRANVEGKNLLFCLGKGERWKSKIKMYENVCTAPVGGSGKRVRRNCHIPLPVLPPQSFNSPLHSHTSASSWVWAQICTSHSHRSSVGSLRVHICFEQIVQRWEGLPHLPAAQDSTQNSKHTAVWMLSDAVTEPISLS